MKKLFLDDLRTVDMVYDKSEGDLFDVVRNYEDFVSYIKANGPPDFINLITTSVLMQMKKLLQTDMLVQNGSSMNQA